MAGPLNITEPPVYGQGQKVEQAQKTTKAITKAKAAVPVPTGEAAPAPVASEAPGAPAFGGPQGMLQIPQAAPTYQAPFKTESEKNQEVATMFEILAEKSPTWQQIVKNLLGEA